MNNIATRGYGQSNKIPTWGYGGDITESPEEHLIIKDRFYLKRMVERVFTLDILCPVLFESKTNLNIYCPIELKAVNNFDISAKVFKENSKTYEINSTAEVNNEYTIQLNSSLDPNKLIKILKVL